MTTTREKKIRTRTSAGWRETWSQRSLGWRTVNCVDEDHIITVENLDVIRRNLIQLRLRSPVVAGIGDRIALLALGHKGLIPFAQTSDEGWNQSAAEYWQTYTKTCDIRKRATLQDIQRLCVATRPILGGVYVHLLKTGEIELIEPERIRQPSKAEEAKKFVNGVQIEKTTGRILSYCVHSRDEMGGFFGKHDERIIPANEMLAVIAKPWRVDMVRELPDLAAIESTLRDLDDLNRRVIKTARLQSGMIGSISSSGELSATNLGRRGRGAAADADSSSRNVYEFDWGLLLKGQGNEEIKLLSSPTPSSNYAPHIRLQYTLIGAALGLPYEVLMLDSAGLSYSSVRAVMMQARNATQPWREWLINSFLQPLWNWRIARAISNRELAPAPKRSGISEWQNVKWVCVEPLWADRDDEARANIYDLQLGLNNPVQLAAERGQDVLRNIEAKARFLARVKDIAASYGVDPAALFKAQLAGQAKAKEFRNEVQNETDTGTE